MTAIQKAREALVSIANTYDESYSVGCLERSIGDKARSALAALDAETPATPADVGEEPAAWRWKQIGRTDVDAWSYRPSKPQAPPADYVVEPIYSATALERVVRERDSFKLTVTRVWDALGNPAYETLEGRSISEVVANWKSRATSAEAKLAEARKVIAGWLSAEDQWDCTKGADDLVKERMSTARRFLEETK